MGAEKLEPKYNPIAACEQVSKMAKTFIDDTECPAPQALSLAHHMWLNSLPDADEEPAAAHASHEPAKCNCLACRLKDMLAGLGTEPMPGGSAALAIAMDRDGQIAPGEAEKLAAQIGGVMNKQSRLAIAEAFASSAQ